MELIVKDGESGLHLLVLDPEVSQGPIVHLTEASTPIQNLRENVEAAPRLIEHWAKRLNSRWLPTLAMGDIASIRANQNATFIASITAISAPREVTSSRGTSSVADATLQDDTGTTTLTLWGDDISRYAVGMKIQITDGWVKDFKGKLQVSLGRSGKITVLP